MCVIDFYTHENWWARCNKDRQEPRDHGTETRKDEAGKQDNDGDMMYAGLRR